MMWKSLLDWLCPARVELRRKKRLLAKLTECSAIKTSRIQQLEDVISNNKTIFTDEVSKLAITSHAIHRYRERHKGKGTDDDISKMLFKCLVQQLYTTDHLSDGKYSLRKGVVGVIENNTLVSILPARAAGQLS